MRLTGSSLSNRLAAACVPTSSHAPYLLPVVSVHMLLSRMLYEYVEKKRKENSGAQLHVTYLVSGSLIQNGHSCHKVAVVREDKLEAVKSKLAVTASVHVYSIQKAMLKDSGPLFNTDYDILKSNLQNCSKFSAIQCAAAVPRAPAESSSSRKFEQSSLQAASETQANELTTNGHGPPASKQVSQQPKGIMGMLLSKAATKTQDTNKETKAEAKEVTNASSAGGKAPGKGNMMSNFFGKAAMSKGKRIDLSDEEAKETENLKKKRRRRIKLPQSDSSEDEVFPDSPEMYEANSPSPPPPASPPPESVPKPESPPVKSSSGENKRKRKRVLKSKTFVDEEGCIVTEKVYETESCTDSEEEGKMKVAPVHRSPAAAVKKETKEEPRKGPKKGTAALGKANRQVSITGFFQKK
ncbi:DNA polymerase delta subunit 3 [Microtus ochrogaster]|uniref:DNA polymerase delta subunit 3 n=1 Tax=Microtus ochrogaster TaxID=79684 RepID=A0A8J6FVR4_MICOH|nr:DNA polymerase delta subunit 3 [Microtus ochrogaster]